jgi:putative copper resistance protein D
MTTTWFILARAIHFGACLLFFGAFAFDRLVATVISTGDENPAIAWWQSRIRFCGLILLPLILLSGMAWLALVAETMGGEPLTMDILKTVWDQTQFGTVCLWRLIFWLAAATVLVVSFVSKPPIVFGKFLAWLQLLFGGCLLGSLAWAGHGQESSLCHLCADILHLLVAGFWPAGLLPMYLLLRKLRRAGGAEAMNSTYSSTYLLVRRFSALSLASVALLTATGLVNGWYLVGSLANLSGQIYGRWLLLKVVLFVLAVAIGAINLLRLKPRLSANNPAAQKDEAAARLQFNVQMELLLGAIIVIVVAILGILPPAIQ